MQRFLSPVSNGLWPLLRQQDVCQLHAFAGLQARTGRSKYIRAEHGDQFGAPSKDETSEDGKIQACFAAIPQADHLGVEFATEAQELRADRLFRGTKNLQGVVIDDFFAVSVQPASNGAPMSKAAQSSKIAKKTYVQQGLLGSDDVVAAEKAKVIGGELDAPSETRSPVRKRLALAHTPPWSCPFLRMRPTLA